MWTKYKGLIFFKGPKSFGLLGPNGPNSKFLATSLNVRHLYVNTECLLIIAAMLCSTIMSTDGEV